ncbi:MAG: hypothetical protein U1E73_06810 [Planctomycetota bacterium]
MSTKAPLVVLAVGSVWKVAVAGKGIGTCASADAPAKETSMEVRMEVRVWRDDEDRSAVMLPVIASRIVMTPRV